MAKRKNTLNQTTSKGERRSSMRTHERNTIARRLNQQKALRAGKAIVITIENPDKTQTNRRFIKKRITLKDLSHG